MTTFVQWLSLFPAWFYSKWQQLGLLIYDAVFYWQLVIIAISFGVALYLKQYIEKRNKKENISADKETDFSKLSAYSYFVIPLASFILLSFFRHFVEKIGYPLLLDYLIPLMLAITLVRAVIYVLLSAFPRRWRWIITFQRSLNIVIWTVLILYVFGVTNVIIDAFKAIQFPVGKQQINLWMIVHALFTVAIYFIIALWLVSIIESRLKALKHIDSNARVVIFRISQAILLLIALFNSLSILGIDITTLSIFSGALGVGLGFGFQKIASNYISGFIILLDRSIRIGNLISIDNNTSGIVSQITNRYTVVRNLSGIEFIVPNETLVTNTVQNQSWSDPAVRVVIKIQVSYSSNIEQALKIMEDSARSHARVMSTPAPLAYLVDFGDNGINLELGFWVNDPQEGTAFTRSQINMIIWRAFKDANIEFPFPQREVRIIGGAHDEVVPLSVERKKPT